MTKANLIDRVIKKTGMKKKDAEAAVDAVFDTMTEALVEGEKVQILGFGAFTVKEREARAGRNPYTNEPMDIPATKHLSFTVSKSLKEQL